MGAMLAAILSQADFIGVDTVADQNRYNIPYYLMFKKEFGDVFAALWSQNEAVVRPVMYRAKDEGGNVPASAPLALAHKTPIRGSDYIVGFDYPKKHDVLCTGAPKPDCLDSRQMPAPVNLQISYTARIYALYFGMAAFSVNYDYDYAKQNQLFKVGSGEAVQIPTGFHAYEVPDIINGARYVAIEKDDACTVATDRPVLCDNAEAGCAAKKAACPNAFSTPAIRAAWLAAQYLQVVQNPAICPMPYQLRQSGDTTCMTDVEAANPIMVEQRRREYQAYYYDAIHDLDYMRGFYGVFGKAF